MSTPIVPTLKGQCIAEFLGTALLIFFGTGCVAALKLGGADLGLWEICIIWGIGVSMAVYLAAGVSGAHLNPAVTIALWLFGTFERHRVPAYILAQVAASVADQIAPIDDVRSTAEYRRDVAGVLLKRTIQEAVA